MFFCQVRMDFLNLLGSNFIGKIIIVKIITKFHNLNLAHKSVVSKEGKYA